VEELDVSWKFGPRPEFSGAIAAIPGMEETFPGKGCSDINETYGHGDHLGDAVAIAQRTDATIIVYFERSSWPKTQKRRNSHFLHIGGGFDFPWKG
jgi:L-ascorbate metabolism protein UlaG (beta-lactamase superfamily)